MEYLTFRLYYSGYRKDNATHENAIVPVSLGTIPKPPTPMCHSHLVQCRNSPMPISQPFMYILPLLRQHLKQLLQCLDLLLRRLCFLHLIADRILTLDALKCEPRVEFGCIQDHLVGDLIQFIISQALGTSLWSIHCLCCSRTKDTDHISTGICLLNKDG